MYEAAGVNMYENILGGSLRNPQNNKHYVRLSQGQNKFKQFLRIFVLHSTHSTVKQNLQI